MGRGRSADAGLTGPPRVKTQCGLNTVKAGVFRRGPATRGLQPKRKPPLLEVVLIWGDGFVLKDAGHMECDDSGTRRGERARI